MNKSEFVRILRKILSEIKLGPNDSSADEIIAFFLNNVSQKSEGKWDVDVATQEIRQIEWAFKVQSKEVRQASLVRENDVIGALQAFIKDRSYDYRSIPTSSPKTPDGFIQGFGNKYLCEVKSPLLKFDHNSSPFGYKFKTIHRKILDCIHQASNQFMAKDPDHIYPHILIYTSAHFQLCWKNFIDAVLGGVEIPQQQKLQPDLRNTEIYLSTRDLIPEIDGYVWLQISSSRVLYQASYFYIQGSVYQRVVYKLFNNLYKIRLSDMDNFHPLQL